MYITHNKMRIISIILLLLATSIYAVFNGIPVQQGEYAYLVYIMVDNGSNTTYACTGGLINSHYVISAGHCTFGGTFTIIVGRIDVAGYFKTDLVNATKVTRPSDFGANGVFDYDDIAVFELETPVAEVAGKIEYLNIGLNAPPTGAPLNLAGYGAIGYNNWTTLAHHGIIHVAPNNQCSLYYFRSEIAYCSVDPDVYSCPGDSGSPIVVKPSDSDRYVLVGVDSFGYNGDCGRKLPDGVISKVAMQIDFIKANTPLEAPTFVTVSEWGTLVTVAPSSTAPVLTTTASPTTTSTDTPTPVATTTAVPTTTAPTTLTPTTSTPTDTPSPAPTTAAPTTSPPSTKAATTTTTTIAPSTTLPTSVGNPTGPVISIAPSTTAPSTTDIATITPTTDPATIAPTTEAPSDDPTRTDSSAATVHSELLFFAILLSMLL
jgi:secreted trypsin-like serine protease